MLSKKQEMEARGYRAIPRAEWERDHWDTAGGVRYDRWALAVGPPLQESQQTSRLHTLLEASGVPPLQPEAALDFFRSLVPTLGTDPQRLADGRRTAFTLAAATDLELLEKVKDAIAAFLAGQLPTPPAIPPTLDNLPLWQHHLPAPPRLDTPKVIARLLDDAGVTPANPQYAEAVYRTNAMDSYNTGLSDELQREQETFPVWKYSNPKDSRSRPRHAELDGNYYPSSRTFASVRGTTPDQICNCRCTGIPIDKWEWSELQAQGATLAI